jgi:transposase-like protein
MRAYPCFNQSPVRGGKRRRVSVPGVDDAGAEGVHRVGSVHPPGAFLTQPAPAEWRKPPRSASHMCCRGRHRDHIRAARHLMNGSLRIWDCPGFSYLHCLECRAHRKAPVAPKPVSTEDPRPRRSAPGRAITRVAVDLYVSENGLRNWVRQDRICRGEIAGVTTSDGAAVAYSVRRQVTSSRHGTPQSSRALAGRRPAMGTACPGQSVVG